MTRAFIAYATSRKTGQTIYVAKVKLYNTIAGRPGYLQSFTGIGDTREDAETSALQYMKEFQQREGVQVPDAVNLGKVTLAALDHPYFFGKAS